MFRSLAYLHSLHYGRTATARCVGSRCRGRAGGKKATPRVPHRLIFLVRGSSKASCELLSYLVRLADSAAYEAASGAQLPASASPAQPTWSTGDPADCDSKPTNTACAGTPREDSESAPAGAPRAISQNETRAASFHPELAHSSLRGSSGYIWRRGRSHCIVSWSCDRRYMPRRHGYAGPAGPWVEASSGSLPNIQRDGCFR